MARNSGEERYNASLDGTMAKAILGPLMVGVLCLVGPEIYHQIVDYKKIQKESKAKESYAKELASARKLAAETHYKVHIVDERSQMARNTVHWEDVMKDAAQNASSEHLPVSQDSLKILTASLKGTKFVFQGEKLEGKTAGQLFNGDDPMAQGHQEYSELKGELVDKNGHVVANVFNSNLDLVNISTDPERNFTNKGSIDELVFVNGRKISVHHEVEKDGNWPTTNTAYYFPFSQRHNTY